MTNCLQVITWTNDDPVHWCIYAALGEDELTAYFGAIMTFANINQEFWHIIPSLVVNGLTYYKFKLISAQSC